MLLTSDGYDLSKCAWLSLESMNNNNWGKEWTFEVPQRLCTRTSSYRFETGTMYVTPQLRKALDDLPKCVRICAIIPDEQQLDEKSRGDSIREKQK